MPPSTRFGLNAFAREFNPVEGIDPDNVRQDAPVLGLPLPPHNKGWPDMAEEDVSSTCSG